MGTDTVTSSYAGISNSLPTETWDQLFISWVAVSRCTFKASLFQHYTLVRLPTETWPQPFCRGASSYCSTSLFSINPMLCKVLPLWYPDDGISSTWYDSRRPHLKCLMLHLNLQRSSIFLVAILKQKSCFRKEGFLKSWKQTTDHRRPC